MRKWVWYGVGMTVACAVGVYVAADYAAKHPDSYVGRCVLTAAHVGMRSNPLVVMEPTLARRAVSEMAVQVGHVVVVGVGANAGGPEHAGRIDKPVCKPEGDPMMEAAEAAEPVEAEEPEQPEELIRIEVLPCRPQHVEPKPDDEVVNAIRQFAGGVEFPAQTEEPLVGKPEACQQPHGEPQVECVEVPLTEAMVEAMVEGMLVFPSKPPKHMPYAEETAAANKFKKYPWLWELMGLCPLGPEYELIPAPTYEETSAPTPDETEEPQTAVEEGMVESTECPEELNRHHHRHHQHGCPYMGRCYPYYTPPAVTPVETPPEDAVKKPAKKKHKKVFKLLWLANEAGWLDLPETMEFRPSDDTSEWFSKLIFHWGP
jgi:hypothetical protein